MSREQSAQSKAQSGSTRQGSSSPHALCAMRYALFLALFVFHFALVAIAFGAEEAAHKGVWEEYRWQLLNFAILVIVLVWFVKKPFMEFLRKRTEVIEKTLQEAQEAKALAQKALAEVEERLKLKDKEIEEIMAQAERSGRREQALLAEQGEQMKEKILEQARNNIDYELRLAKDSIKAEAVEIALELAEKKLKEKLTKEEQKRLMEEALARMEAKN